MAFFFCLSSMAQVVLGDINFSLKEGQKINPKTGKITVTFPNVTGVADPAATNFVIAGAFSDIDFDGVEGSFASGVTLDLAEFELQPATAYTLKITSVKVDGAELAPAEGYVLNFKTRGADRKTSWSFAIDDASLEQIAAQATENAEAQDPAKYIDITKSGNARYYVPARNYEEIMLPDGTALPATEDLLFKFGEKVFYVSGHGGGWADAIVSDGFDASTGVKDSIQLGSAYANFKFEVQTAGDITFRFSNCYVKTIEISEAQPKLPRNYNVVAAFVGEDNTTVLKELVGKTEGVTGSTIKVNYPYWLTDADGKVYTHGAKGSEFVEAFDLKNGEGDTTFVVSYKATEYAGVVFLSEGEDLTGAVECTNGNAVVRSSMGKAGYVTEDLKLVTLQPGTYKVRAVLFDADRDPAYICTLTKGAGEENEIYLSAVSTNWTETESDLLTITEPTDITLKAGGGENHGVDVIMIYAATDNPDGIVELKATKKAEARKVVKNGQVLIETEAGIFNTLGVQMK